MVSQQFHAPNGVHSLKPRQTHDEAAYAAYVRYCASVGVVNPAPYAAWLKLTTRISAVNWLAKDDLAHPRPLNTSHGLRGVKYEDLAYATA